MFMGPIYGHKPAMARSDERRRGNSEEWDINILLRTHRWNLGALANWPLIRGADTKLRSSAEAIIIIDNNNKEATVLYLVRPKDLTRVTCVLAGLLVVTRGSGSTCTSPNIRLVRAWVGIT